MIVLLSFFFTQTLFAQIIPTAGETECFVAGNGAVFADQGGTEANPVTGTDPAGFYFNCACETVTTLCSPDGSAITLDFTAFEVFAAFDFIEIYDGDSNAGTLLYGNATGAPNANDVLLADMIASSGSSSFTGTTGCITVSLFATAVVNRLGWEADVTVASGATHPGDNLPCGTNLNCLAPPNVSVDNLTNTSADITWAVSDSADTYNIEYGLAGFVLGTGTLTNTTDLFLNLTGLMQNTDYQFYIQSDCGGGEMSNFAGPFSFTTLLSCPAPTNVMITDINSTFVDISWDVSIAAIGYNVEYGLAGFALGSGTVINTTGLSTTINGLIQNTAYDFYVHSDCDNELSNNAVVNSFNTTFNSACDYKIELFDSFGDGWNGSILNVTVGSISTDYTVPAGGSFAEFTIGAGSNIAMIFTYTAGAFQNEVTYNILDPNGDIIFSDGPNPATGIVYETFACPTCPGATNLGVDDLFGSSADISWMDSDSAGVWQVEYGPTGFLPNTGAGITFMTNDPFASLTGLDENSTYDYYVIRFCDGGDTSALAGPFTFTTLPLNDVGIIQIVSPSNGCDAGDAEVIRVLLTNFGAYPQSLIPFKYSVNGVTAAINIPLDGYFTDVIGKDSIIELEFEATSDFSSGGTFEIAAWTELDGDSNMSNDTAKFVLETFTKLPIKEDFEEGIFPLDWTTSGINPVTDQHNNISFVAFNNMYSFNNFFEITSPEVGVVADGDSLHFDYRFVDWSAGTDGTILGLGDSLVVKISTDCGMTYETFYVITQDNHITSSELTTVDLDLSSFAGEVINVKFEGIWGTGDYFLDIDNINIYQCANITLATDVIPESVAGASDGTISVIPASVGPYTYLWSTGDTTAQITDLTAGVFSVTVVDFFGCSTVETFDFQVGFEEIDNIQKINLFPNPTMDVATLDMTFAKTVDVQVQVINVMGQILFETSIGKTMEEKVELNLENYPDGMYFVRVKVDSQTIVKKLMKNNP